MFLDVLRFELKYIFRRPAIYIFLVCVFLMGFSVIASDSFQVGGSVSNAARNSPFEVMRILSMFSLIGVIAITGFVATAVNRDREFGCHEILFSTPLSRTAYLGGRFAGALAAATIAVAAAIPGMILAAQMPWLDPERILPFSAGPYLYTLLVFIVPNLFMVGALLFSVATLTRRAFPAWIAMIAVFIFWGLAKVGMQDLESMHLAAVLDPFGVTPFELVTRYWTVVEKNTLLLPVDRWLVLNRALWAGVGFGFLALTRAKFRLEVTEGAARVGRRAKAAAIAAAGAVADARTDLSMPVPVSRQYFGSASRLAQWRQQVGVELSGVLKSVPFLVLMVLAVFNISGSLSETAGGVSRYPVTWRMIQIVKNTYDFMIVIIMVVYSGWLVWRERSAGMHEIQSTMPVPSWMPLTAKLAALLGISVVALGVAFVTTVAYQLGRGYTDIDLALYAKGLFGVLLPYWMLIASLGIVVHVFTNNKIAGFAVVGLYLIAVDALPAIDIGHHMLIFAETPNAPYSDMNGYGHFVAPLFWYNLYWWFLIGAAMVLASLFWVRSTEARARARWREARRRTTRPTVAALGFALAGFLATGGFIFYNTTVLNEYVSEREDDRLSAEYEKRYKQYEDVPQPRVTAVSLDVDIYPDERRVEVRGDMELVNKTSEPVTTLHVRLNPDAVLDSFGVPESALVVNDEELGYRIYDLDPALAPGDTLELPFATSVVTHGFVDRDSNTRVLGNGTFFDNSYCAPCFGYSRDNELSSPVARKRNGLPKRDGLPPVDDARGLSKTWGGDADRIRYEATLSTSADQIAVTAGYLEREWTEGGRRYFRYKMDAPILNFYPIVSGEYEVERSAWRGVEIEVYHDRHHPYNVARMIESVQDALAYYTENFGPYQHRVARVLEFPRYRHFAQSFATTVPYSESSGFIHDVRDEDKIDMVYYVTAHEIAHQWWGHQVVVGRVQGATFIEESLAQYSALMVMEKNYGRERMKKFLAYELDRYLSGRGYERDRERPLALVENQAYIHYFKGSVVMYALRDYIGEERVNAALRSYLQKVGYEGPPYTNSPELIAELRAVTPDEYQYLIDDMIENITLYDNRVEGVTCEETDGGRYRVSLAVRSHKYRADELGAETEVEHDDWIEIGIFGERSDDAWGDGKPLYLEKRRVPTGESVIEIVVDERPRRAGIDPRCLLIDRVPDDNVRSVSVS